MSSAVILIVAAALAASALGYATALKGPRWHGLGLVAALAVVGLSLGGFGLSNSDPLYIGAAFGIIVPWLLGGFIVRMQRA
jgi:hypothetical protein